MFFLRGQKKLSKNVRFDRNYGEIPTRYFGLPLLFIITDKLIRFSVRRTDQLYLFTDISFKLRTTGGQLTA